MAASRRLAQRFGKNLVTARKAADVSQEGLAFLASLHRTEVGMIERGIRLARIDTLVKLAGALEVSPADLLQGIDWKPTDPRVGSFQVKEENELQ